MAYCCSAETMELMYYENEDGDDALTKLGRAKLAAKPCISCEKDVRIYGINSWLFVRPAADKDSNLGKSLAGRVAKFTGKKGTELTRNDVICRSCSSAMERKEARDANQEMLRAKYADQGARIREKIASREKKEFGCQVFHKPDFVPTGANGSSFPRGSSSASPSTKIPKPGLFSPQFFRRGSGGGSRSSMKGRLRRSSRISDETGSETGSSDGDPTSLDSSGVFSSDGDSGSGTHSPPGQDRRSNPRHYPTDLIDHELSQPDGNHDGIAVADEDRPNKGAISPPKPRRNNLMSTSSDDMNIFQDHKTSPDKMSAVELKEQGNRFFANKKYDEAISCYTKAIMKNPQDAKFFTNRALCNMKLKKWPVVSDDCRNAIEIDQSSVKGYFFLGIAQLEQELYDEAINNLRKAHELAREQKKNFGDDIASQLRLARRKRWNIMEEKRISQEIALQKYLHRLMAEDQERQSKNLEKSKDDIGEEAVEKKKSEVQKEVSSYKDDLDNLFAAVDDRRKKREVPDYLCGKISFELMRDPVITPSGITYDRKDIEQHLQRVGHFDPITRVKLSQEQLIPNLSMKEIINYFVTDNEWVEDY